MIYKRGKCKLDSEGRCEKCGKRGSCGNYWYKFMWLGKLVRESTKQGSDKIARQMESAHRTKLALGEVGIRQKEPTPTLAEFLKNDFLAYAKTKHGDKPNTLRYYVDGAKGLSNSTVAKTPLDQVSDQHAQQYAKERAGLSASGINRGLRTLRRALNLAFQWGQLERPVKIALAAGERQRDRVLLEEEENKYLNACPQPWRDRAAVIFDEGFRPSKVFSLRWERVFFNDDGTGLIQIVTGKSRAARRMLPMTPRVYALLRTRYESSGCTNEGWIFPSSGKDGHFNGDTAKDQHKKALTDSGVNPFVPYTLRHTALTRLGDAAGGDIFALARMAGHNTIAVTQRYIHPQADAINRVFAMRGGHKIGHNQKTKKDRTVRTLGRGTG